MKMAQGITQLFQRSVGEDDFREDADPVATFDCTDWTLSNEGPFRLVYRPGRRTFLLRLGLSAFSAAVILVICGLTLCCVSLLENRRYVLLSKDAPFRETYVRVRQDWQKELAQLEARARSPRDEGRKAWEEYLELQEKLNVSEEAYQRVVAAGSTGWARFYRTAEGVSKAIARGVCVVFAVVGIFAPLSCLWQRLVIEQGPQGDFTVRTRLLGIRARSWRPDSFSGISMVAQRNLWRIAGFRKHRGWRWSVSLTAGTSDGIGRTAVPVVEFRTHFQRERPDENRVPKRVVGFAWRLYKLTGLPCGRCVILGSEPRGRLGASREKGSEHRKPIDKPIPVGGRTSNRL